MKRKALWSLVALIAVFSSLSSAPDARSEEYPDKTIEFICSGTAGTGFDMFVRGTAFSLNDEGIVKPKIQTTNRTGGGATVAINYLAAKKGDPNVLMSWTTSPIVTLLRGTTTVKDIADLTLLCALAEDPNLLVVRADSKYKTLKDLIEDARKNPDKVSGSIGTIGGTEHIIMNRIEKATGVKFNITAFGASEIPVLGGHTNFTFGPPGNVQQSVIAGKLRVLAVAGDVRSQVAPDAPTMKEEGVNASFTQLRGYWGPPEMPDYAVKFWGQAFAKLQNAKTFKDLLGKLSMEPVYMGPEQLKKMLPDYARALAADVKDLEVYGGKKN